jgi:hypothetical protein
MPSLLPLQETMMIDYEREPTLEDVLSDPLVHAMMARDRVGIDEVRALLDRLRNAQRRRPPGEAKAAAAHEWMTSLHERGRCMGLRYSARSVIDA